MCSEVFWESGSIKALAGWNWCTTLCGGIAGRGKRSKCLRLFTVWKRVLWLPGLDWFRCLWVPVLWCSVLVWWLIGVKTSDCFWTWPETYPVPRGIWDSPWARLVCAASSCYLRPRRGQRVFGAQRVSATPLGSACRQHQSPGGSWQRCSLSWRGDSYPNRGLYLYGCCNRQHL